jgi:hypothetical protein
MLLTAFNGGGGHVFRRLNFESSLARHNRDAVHFSDQRVGSTIVDSVVGYSSDDLFNIHTTLMVVLKCDAVSSCLMVNPHLSGAEFRNTVYGSNSVLEMVAPGVDAMSFYAWPTTTFDTRRFPGAPLGVVRTERIADAALLDEAATLVPQLAQVP